MREELKQIAIAIKHVDNEFEAEKNHHFDNAEQIEFFSEIAYLMLLAFVDRHNLIGLREYITTKWKNYENELSKSYYSEIGCDDFLYVTTNFLNPVVRSLTNLYGKEPDDVIIDNVKFKIPELIQLLPNTATRLSLSITNENDLDKLIEAFLIPLYPNINSNPALILPEGYRQPDSSIPSLNLLIEYKFINKKTDLRNIIDEIQADIRNYAQEPWQYLYVVIGMNDNYTTEVKMKNTVFKEPSTFKKMFLSIIRF